jgi:hypothetical protein
MECKDRKKRSSLMLSYTFLPSMTAKKLSDAANKVLLHVSFYIQRNYCFKIGSSGVTHYFPMYPLSTFVSLYHVFVLKTLNGAPSFTAYDCPNSSVV